MSAFPDDFTGDAAVPDIDVNEVGVRIEPDAIEGQPVDVPFELVEAQTCRYSDISGGAEDVLGIGDAADIAVMFRAAVAAVNVQGQPAAISAKLFEQGEEARISFEGAAVMAGEFAGVEVLAEFAAALRRIDNVRDWLGFFKKIGDASGNRACEIVLAVAQKFSVLRIGNEGGFD